MKAKSTTKPECDMHHTEKCIIQPRKMKKLISKHVQGTVSPSAVQHEDSELQWLALLSFSFALSCPFSPSTSFREDKSSHAARRPHAFPALVS